MLFRSVAADVYAALSSSHMRVVCRLNTLASEAVQVGLAQVRLAISLDVVRATGATISSTLKQTVVVHSNKLIVHPKDPL